MVWRKNLLLLPTEMKEEDYKIRKNIEELAQDCKVRLNILPCINDINKARFYPIGLSGYYLDDLDKIKMHFEETKEVGVR